MLVSDTGRSVTVAGPVRDDAAMVRRLRTTADSARASHELAEDDRKSRDAVIGEADARGWGIREIARETGLSASHVQRIIIAQTAAAQDGESSPERYY